MKPKEQDRIISKRNTRSNKPDNPPMDDQDSKVKSDDQV